MQAIVDQLRAEGYPVDGSDLAHISPCRFEHINKYGEYHFDVEQERNRQQLRPLRQSKSPANSGLD